MNHLEALRAATVSAQKEADLPDFLAVRIFRIADSLSGSMALKEEIIDLSNQVAQYDTFGQTGYCGMGVDNHILERTIEKVEALVRQL
jgi:hypothetical protein